MYAIRSYYADETLPTVEPPAPLISVAEAEAQVGFNVAEIPYVPEGFDYLGARLYGNNVSLDYMTKGYGHMIIMQSQGGFYQSDWDSVPADEILPVKIGDLVITSYSIHYTKLYEFLAGKRDGA